MVKIMMLLQSWAELPVMGCGSRFDHFVHLISIADHCKLAINQNLLSKTLTTESKMFLNLTSVFLVLGKVLGRYEKLDFSQKLYFVV
jgi:hypothetical protein